MDQNIKVIYVFKNRQPQVRFVADLLCALKLHQKFLGEDVNYAMCMIG